MVSFDSSAETTFMRFFPSSSFGEGPDSALLTSCGQYSHLEIERQLELLALELELARVASAYDERVPGHRSVACKRTGQVVTLDTQYLYPGELPDVDLLALSRAPAGDGGAVEDTVFQYRICALSDLVRIGLVEPESGRRDDAAVPAVGVHRVVVERRLEALARHRRIEHPGGDLHSEYVLVAFLLALLVAVDYEVARLLLRIREEHRLGIALERCQGVTGNYLVEPPGFFVAERRVGPGGLVYAAHQYQKPLGRFGLRVEAVESDAFGQVDGLLLEIPVALINPHTKVPLEPVVA